MSLALQLAYELLPVRCHPQDVHNNVGDLCSKIKITPDLGDCGSGTLRLRLSRVYIEVRYAVYLAPRLLLRRSRSGRHRAGCRYWGEYGMNGLVYVAHEVVEGGGCWWGVMGGSPGERWAREVIRGSWLIVLCHTCWLPPAALRLLLSSCCSAELLLLLLLVTVSFHSYIVLLLYLSPVVPVLYYVCSLLYLRPVPCLLLTVAQSCTMSAPYCISIHSFCYLLNDASLYSSYCSILWFISFTLPYDIFFPVFYVAFLLVVLADSNLLYFRIKFSFKYIFTSLRLWQRSCFLLWC